MSQPTAPRRRWYQFRLASLLWLTLFVPMCVFGIREHQRRVRLEAEAERLRTEVSTLQGAVDRTQRVSIAAQHRWITELRGLYQEKIIQEQNLAKQLQKRKESRVRDEGERPNHKFQFDAGRAETETPEDR